MKKSIAIFGGSLFQDIIYSKGEYIPTKKQASIKLGNFYRIDNYSLHGLSIHRAKGMLLNLPMKDLYSDCVLALGEADLANPDAFKEALLESIEYLQENQIHPLLVSLPKEAMMDERGMRIQQILDEAAVLKNVDYIYDGRTHKQVSYMVIEDRDIEQAILNLC